MHYYDMRKRKITVKHVYNLVSKQFRVCRQAFLVRLALVYSLDLLVTRPHNMKNRQAEFQC